MRDLVPIVIINIHIFITKITFINNTDFLFVPLLKKFPYFHYFLSTAYKDLHEVVRHRRLGLCVEVGCLFKFVGADSLVILAASVTNPVPRFNLDTIRPESVIWVMGQRAAFRDRSMSIKSSMLRSTVCWQIPILASRTSVKDLI